MKSVKEMLAKGLDRETIISSLLTQGYTKQEIDFVFPASEQPNNPPPHKPANTERAPNIHSVKSEFSPSSSETANAVTPTIIKVQGNEEASSEIQSEKTKFNSLRFLKILFITLLIALAIYLFIEFTPKLFSQIINLN